MSDDSRDYKSPDLDMGDLMVDYAFIFDDGEWREATDWARFQLGCLGCARRGLTVILMADDLMFREGLPGDDSFLKMPCPGCGELVDRVTAPVDFFLRRINAGKLHNVTYWERVKVNLAADWNAILGRLRGRPR